MNMVPRGHFKHDDFANIIFDILEEINMTEDDIEVGHTEEIAVLKQGFAAVDVGVHIETSNPKAMLELMEGDDFLYLLNTKLPTNSFFEESRVQEIKCVLHISGKYNKIVYISPDKHAVRVLPKTFS